MVIEPASNRLFANLEKLLPLGLQKKRAKVTVRKGSSTDDLLDGLGIPQSMTNVITVNGVHRSAKTELNDGDIIGIFPPIAGG